MFPPQKIKGETGYFGAIVPYFTAFVTQKRQNKPQQLQPTVWSNAINLITVTQEVLSRERRCRITALMIRLYQSSRRLVS